MRKEIISIIKEQYWGLINDRQWIQIILTPVFLIGIIMIVLQEMLFASYGETKVSLFIITIALSVGWAFLIVLPSYLFNRKKE